MVDLRPVRDRLARSHEKVVHMYRTDAEVGVMFTYMRRPTNGIIASEFVGIQVSPTVHVPQSSGSEFWADVESDAPNYGERLKVEFLDWDDIDEEYQKMFNRQVERTV